MPALRDDDQAIKWKILTAVKRDGSIHYDEASEIMRQCRWPQAKRLRLFKLLADFGQLRGCPDMDVFC